MKLNKTKKHIVILCSGGRVVTKNSPTGGIFMLNQARLIAKNYSKVSLLSTGYVEFSKILEKDKYLKTEILNGLEVRKNYKKHLIPRRFVPYNFQKKMYSKLALSQFEDYIRVNGLPDIIHAHNILFSGVSAQIIYEKYKVPYVITDHSSAFYMNVYHKNLTSRLQNEIRDCKRMSTVSMSNSRTLKSFISFEIFIFPNFIEDHFTYLDLRDPSGFEFICVANLIPMKNVSDLLISFGELHKKYNVRLKIIGKGPLKTSLLNLVIKLKIEDKVEWIDYLTSEQMNEAFNVSNCLILPSTYETFGVVVVEALATGMPVIVTKCGGPENFVDSENGLIIDVNNIPQLKKAMEKIILNYNLFDHLSISKNAKLKFGKKAFLKNLKLLYEN